ncbi:hypothetical protein AYO40_03175 [Planctomycetaceae bacterium SCGC AG-212-D15]|nr:hypothetical protein AYO40_03175 [Planctomycetaceae bacterium SCGC AG-212-D15]
MVRRPLLTASATCAFGAIATVACMFWEEFFDQRPRGQMFSPAREVTEIVLWILWVIAPYAILALLNLLVRRREQPARAAFISSVLITVPCLILVSPLIYSPPHPGWFDLSWNGALPFALVPLGQWLLVAVAAVAVGIVWARSRQAI